MTNKTNKTESPYSEDAITTEASNLQSELGDDFQDFLHNLLLHAGSDQDSPGNNPELEAAFKKQAYRNLAEFKLRISRGYQLAVAELSGNHPPTTVSENETNRTQS